MWKDLENSKENTRNRSKFIKLLESTIYYENCYSVKNV